jgi:hypothetical protein
MVNGFPLTGMGKPFEKAALIVYSQIPLSKSSDGVLEHWSIGKEEDDLLAFFSSIITPPLHYSIMPKPVCASRRHDFHLLRGYSQVPLT